jgi:hypothetical protein
MKTETTRRNCIAIIVDAEGSGTLLMDYDTLSDVVVENQVYIYDFFFKYVDIYH